MELKKDGSLSGGGFYYTEDCYLKTPPVSVEKTDNGAYLCTLDKYNYYIIYPVGVIADSEFVVGDSVIGGSEEYILANQPYLKDVVYIRCFVFDGGVLDISYYSDKVA